MEYNNIIGATFIARPNRFIAEIELNGKPEIAHVKNTGRCKELLVPGAKIFVQKACNPLRKTKYDLISVRKYDKIINIDSSAPNRIFHEWLTQGNLFKNVTFIKPEYKYGKSRIDFYIESGGQKVLVEVKGVTLEENGVAMFPDAPTERGIKHIKELEASVLDGYKAYVVFIVQMEGVTYFMPNDRTHKAFGQALRHAQQRGVQALVLDCKVTQNSIEANNYLEVL